MKRLKGMLTLGFLAIFLAGCINIPFGDGGLKINSDGVTITDEEGEEHNVSIDEEGEQFTITGDQGEIAFGSEVDIPASFPDDIPIVDDAQVIAVTDAQGTISVTYGTEMNVDEVDQMYADYFNSNIFEETGDMMITNEGVKITDYEGIRQDGVLYVNISGTSEPDELTTVIIVFDGSVDEE